MSSLERRIVTLLFNVHHVFCLALLICTLNTRIGIALICYGLTVELVILALRITDGRNVRYESASCFAHDRP